MGIQVQPYCCRRQSWLYYLVREQSGALAVLRTSLNGKLTRPVTVRPGPVYGNCLTLDEERSRVLFGGVNGNGLASAITGGIWQGPINPPLADAVQLCDGNTLGITDDSRASWAIDLENEQVFYFARHTAPGVQTHKVMRANLDGTGKTEIVAPGMLATSLFFDQDAKQLYYVRPVPDTVPPVFHWRRVNRDGTGDELLFAGVGGHHFAAAWDIDLEAGYIFSWDARLRRRNLDGSDFVEIAGENVVPPTCIGLDRKRRYIYAPGKRLSYTGSKLEAFVRSAGMLAVRNL